MSCEPARDRRSQTILIWDWDDTLMSSTHLSPYQQLIMQPNFREKLPQDVIRQLHYLEDLAMGLLNRSIKTGTTYIVTNAASNWIKLSASIFFPRLYNELVVNSQEKGIQIVSARARWEPEMPSK